MEEKKHFFEMLGKAYDERRSAFLTFFGVGALFIAFSVLTFARSPIPFTHYFLSVGQGDSEAIILNGGAVALIDGGPSNGKAVRELEKILPFYKRSVDIIFVTHPEEDHFGGLIELIKRYDVGIIATNGDVNDTEAYFEFQKIVEEERIEQIALSKGDSITQGDIKLSVLWPREGERSDPPSSAVADFGEARKPNENALVIFVSSKGKSSLLTADIPADTEREIAEMAGQASLLKVAHHGSKFSSDEEFLYAINPAVAILEVGKNNYGHPSEEVLGRLKNVGAEIFRTDRDGTLGARFIGEKLHIFRVR